MTKIPMLERPSKETIEKVSRFKKYEYLDGSETWHKNKIEVLPFDEDFSDAVEIPVFNGSRYRYFVGWNLDGNATIQRVLREEPENEQ